MFYLINTMDKNETVVGRVISAHRSALAAGKADKRIQPTGNSYIPTKIIESDQRFAKGDYPRFGEFHAYWMVQEPDKGYFTEECFPCDENGEY